MRRPERAKAWLLAAALSLAASPALARDKPEEAFKAAQEKLEAAKSEQEKLNKEKEKLEAELHGLQAKLVKLAAETQKAESELSAAEERLRILSKEQKAKEKELKTREKHLADLVQASISLSHTPPEAMIMMPGDVTRTMKAARALKMASDSVKAETHSLGLQIAELEKLKQKVQQNRDDIAKRRKAHETQQKELVAQLSERKKLQKRLGLEAAQAERNLAQLAKKTSGLKELVEGAEARREEAEEARSRDIAQEMPQHKGQSFAAAKGRIRTPVAGKLLRKFGDAHGKAATAKGVTIETRVHAAVTAPFDGEVVFTGPFLKYGRMVIIRHSDNFHTLLAGLQKIDVEVGQFLLEGEPIGAMGDKASGNELYIELRKDNQPVDPAPWMGALSKRSKS